MSWVIAGLAVLCVLIVLFVVRRRPRRVPLVRTRFTAKWQAIQALCSDKSQWSQALIEADQLLERVLKRRRFRGKKMGERLVAAQRRLSDNEGVWHAHKLAMEVTENPEKQLRKHEIKDALLSIRVALHDLGAIR